MDSMMQLYELAEKFRNFLAPSTSSYFNDFWVHLWKSKDLASHLKKSIHINAHENVFLTWILWRSLKTTNRTCCAASGSVDVDSSVLELLPPWSFLRGLRARTIESESASGGLMRSVAGCWPIFPGLIVVLLLPDFLN